MQRKADGTFKVPQELADAWAKGDQDSMVTEFIDAGLDKDTLFLGGSFYSVYLFTVEKIFMVIQSYTTMFYYNNGIPCAGEKIWRLICRMSSSNGAYGESGKRRKRRNFGFMGGSYQKQTWEMSSTSKSYLVYNKQVTIRSFWMWIRSKTNQQHRFEQTQTILSGPGSSTSRSFVRRKRVGFGILAGYFKTGLNLLFKDPQFSL